MTLWRFASLMYLLLLPLAGRAEVCAVDDRGVRVCLAQPAVRVISLSPHLTEQVFWTGAGDRVIATDDSSDFPAQARDLPKLGRVQQFDVERLLSLRPDLVLAWQSGISPALVHQLEGMGIKVYVSEPLTLAQIADGMRDLTVLTGIPGEAARVDSWLQVFDAMGRQYGQRKPVRVFYQVWETPLMTLGGQHLVSRLIRQCGGVNIFEELELLAPQVSLEEAVGRLPELILASGPSESVMASLAFWRKYPAVPAVQRLALKAFAPDILVRPGPRLLDAAQDLCLLIDEARKP